MALNAFPVPWKKFPETMPKGIIKKAAAKMRMAQAESLMSSGSFGANGATNVSACHMRIAQVTNMKLPA